VSRLSRSTAATALAVVLLTAGTPPATAQATGRPPYEDSLLRLSEILGSIHYLRDLCGADDGNLWRDQMQALIDAEKPDYTRRVGLADSFNRGFDSYRAMHVVCTTAARLTIARYMEEGALLAGEIVARYGEDG